MYIKKLDRDLKGRELDIWLGKSGLPKEKEEKYKQFWIQKAAKIKQKSLRDDEFSGDLATTDDFVFALSCATPVPCSIVEVTLTYTGDCGIEVVGASLPNSIYLVGAGGSVNAVVTPSSGVGSCGSLSPLINGGTDSFSGDDCDELVVTVSSDDGECCPCCQVTPWVCTGVPMRSKSLLYHSGNKLKVNTAMLKQRIKTRQAKTIRSKPTPKLPPTSL